LLLEESENNLHSLLLNPHLTYLRYFCLNLGLTRLFTGILNVATFATCIAQQKHAQNFAIRHK